MAAKTAKKKPSSPAATPVASSVTASPAPAALSVSKTVSSPPAVAKGPYADRATTWRDRVYLTIVFLFAGFIRTYKIYAPSSVVFDEVHFGGFARKYIIGRYFMDVHPPLAKMLFAAVGYLAGYDGEFLFASIGDDYIEPNVPYVAMRLFPAVLGVFVVGLFYLTLRASGCKSGVAFLGAMLLTIENALITQSRLILLDSPLIFFMALTVYAQKKFEIQSPFSLDWYRYLCLTGLGLGATVSSKWYGLFTIGWVGVLTVWQLWFILGDLRVSASKFLGQFTARAIGLIAIPILFYMAMFFISFICLENTGDGASFMSPEFQQSLKHADLIPSSPADIYIGSKISIRHLNTQGGYLHSHDHLYKGGSGQQQVTLYPHRDSNNIWLVENSTHVENPQDLPLEYVTDGMLLKLKHVTTSRRLHSHDVRPPVTEQDYQNEVSAYGHANFNGDANDIFRVKIIPDQSAKGPARERLRTIETKFQLVHVYTGCVLFSHKVKLPKWGFEQQEVTCVKNPSFDNSLWYVETNTHPKLVGDDIEMVTYPTPSFLSKFIELNKVMWRVNAGLTESHHWESRPESWPLLKRGINFWVKDHRQVYLMGNPIIWWSSSATIAIYIIFKILSVLRQQRGFKDFPTGSPLSVFDAGVGSYVIGWAFHYLPSFMMERQLFLHHYLCSLYFACLVLVQTFNYMAARIPYSLINKFLALVFFAASAAAFIWYSPLIYATPWTKSLCLRSSFLDMDFDCNTFLDTYEAYKEYDANKGLPEVGESVLESTTDEGVLETNLVQEEQQEEKAPVPQVEPHKPEDVVIHPEGVNVPIFEQAKEVVESITEPVVEQVKEAAEPVVEQVKEAAEPVVEQAKEAAEPVVEQAKEAAEPVVEQAMEAAEPVVEQAKEAAEPVVEQAKEGIKQAKEAAEQAMEAAEPVVEQAKEAAEPVVEQAKEAAEPVVEQAKEAAEPVVEQAKEAAEPVVEQAKEGVEQAKEAAEPVVEQAKEVVESITEPVIEQAKELVEVEQAEEVVEPIVEQISEPVEEQAEPVPTPATDREPVTEEFHRVPVSAEEIVTSDEPESVEPVEENPIVGEEHIAEPETIRHDEL